MTKHAIARIRSHPKDHCGLETDVPRDVHELGYASVGIGSVGRQTNSERWIFQQRAFLGTSIRRARSEDDSSDCNASSGLGKSYIQV